MIPATRRILAAAAALLAIAAPSAAAAPARPGEIVVRYHGATASQTVRVAPGEAAARLARLRARPDVAWAVPNYIARASALIPNDPGTGAGWQAMQWNFVGKFGINMPEAWELAAAAGTPGGAGVVVAVLDTGVAYRDRGRFVRSPDFGPHRFVKGHDFVAEDGWPLDRNGHGTHVASTIGEQTGNGFGLTGIAYRARIMPVRVLDSRGEGDSATIARGIRFAARRGADVINLSLEFPTSVGPREIPEIIEALRYARKKGTIVVAAAGNASSRSVAYPARAAKVISVAATTERGCLSFFSNEGPGLDLVAPGGGADSDLPGDPNCSPLDDDGRNIFQLTFRRTRAVRDFGYPGDYEGTSMAAPHVTGTIALMLAAKVLGERPTTQQVLSRLRATARDLGPEGPDRHYGYGLIDAAAALRTS